MGPDERVKAIVDAVERDDVFKRALSSVPEAERDAVRRVCEGFAAMVAPLVEAAEQVEASEELAERVRVLLAERARGL